MPYRTSARESVWERQGDGDALSKNFFAFLVCFWTTVGLVGTALSAWCTVDWVPPSVWIFVGILIVPFIGVLIALASDNPLVSMLGYAMIVIPFGIVLGPVVAQYTEASVIKVLAITLTMTITLGMLGSVIPQSLEHWGGWLFSALLVLLLCSFFEPLARMAGLPIEGALTWVDWAAVLVFCAYIVFDFNRAMRVERTVDNSIDCAVAIYLDILNLFLRLLRLLGSAKDDD
jgi:FtsH-binding integral membrane protein